MGDRGCWRRAGWAGSLWAQGRAGGGPYLPGVLKPPVDHLKLQAGQPVALRTPMGHIPGQQETVPVRADAEVLGRRGLHWKERKSRVHKGLDDRAGV